MLDENTFNGLVSLNTGSGEDNTIVRSTNTFNGLFRVKAGDGSSDAIEIVNPNVFNGGRELSRAETATASPTVISSRIDNTTTGVMAERQPLTPSLISCWFPARRRFRSMEIAMPDQLNGNVRVTRSSSFIVDGVTTPRSTVTIDSDGDGQFDDGTTTSAADGTSH